MYHSVDSAVWLWMAFMKVFWIALFGAIIYVAVKSTNKPPGDPKGQH